MPPYPASRNGPGRTSVSARESKGTLPDRRSVTVPDQIVLERDLELAGRGRELWIRRALFALLPLVSLLALLNFFGQRPTDTQASTDAATLKLHAPERVRSGLLYQARFTIEARRDVRNAVLVLDSGWL